MSNTANCRALGVAQKSLLVPQKKLDQCAVVELVAGQKILFIGGRGKTVPRAEQLAVIAAGDAIADERAQRQRYRPLVFDGEVGDATACIDHIGFNDGGGGADLDAGGAAAAVGLDRCTRG